MKLEYKIPNGWSRLPVDCVIKRYDRFPSAGSHEWIPTSACGSKILDGGFYIRKNTAKRRGAKRKGTP